MPTNFFFKKNMEISGTMHLNILWVYYAAFTIWVKIENISTS